MPKVVQVTTYDAGGQRYLIALCDDGVLWRRELTQGDPPAPWEPLPPPPGCHDPFA